MAFAIFNYTILLPLILPALSVLIIRHSLTPLPCLCHCSTMNLSSVSVQMKVSLSVHLRLRNSFPFRLLILFRIRILDCIRCIEWVLCLRHLIRILHLHSSHTGIFPCDISFRIWWCKLFERRILIWGTVSGTGMGEGDVSWFLL